MTTYSHDGIRDSLTQLAAPTLLYEELRRELARAKRENQPISMIRFVLAPQGRYLHDPDSATHSEFEEEVISFAHILSILSRGEDVCARMGELEFVCILHGFEEASQSFVSRISVKWDQVESLRHESQNDIRVRLETASLVSNPGESALDFLNRLDRRPTL